MLLTAYAVGQVSVGSAKAGSVTTGVGTAPVGAAQADFNNRCNATGVVRCSSVSGVGTVGSWNAYPINSAPPLPNVGGTGGFFDSLSASSGTNDGVTSGVPDATVYTVNGGSTKLYQPWNNGGANGGDVTLMPLQDTSVSFYEGSPSGKDYYVQFRKRFDTNMLTVLGGDSTTEGRKDWLATASSRYVSSSTYATMSSCGAFQWVGGDFKLINAPVFYLGCGAQGDYDGNQMNLFPTNDSSVALYQNAIGCTSDKTTTNQRNTITSISRDGSGTTTVVFTSALGAGFIPGASLQIVGTSNPDATVNTYTPFNGIFTIATVNTGTKTVTFAQQGVASSISGGTATGAIMNYNHCFNYQPNQWITFMYHFILGSDYIGNPSSKNYRRDSTVEVYAAYEGNPYQLLVAMPDVDLVLHDQGDVASTNKYNGTPVTPASNWWTSTGLTPSHFGINLLNYWNYRCQQATVTAVQRSSGVVKLTYNLPVVAGGTQGWNMGVGAVCPVIGDKISVTGVCTAAGCSAIDGGSFNTTYTICGTGTTGCSDPTASSLFAVQAGNDVSSTSTSSAGKIEDYRYDLNCNGGNCNQTSWITEFVVSTKFISNPKVCLGASICGGVNNVVTVNNPDPADHLLVTGVNTTTGAVSLSWRCNDATATYKIVRVSGDRYNNDVSQSTGAGWVTATQVGTAGACASQFGTQTFTDSPGNNTTQYSYAVIATNASGDSTRSGAVMNTPGIPSDVTATFVAANNVGLTWIPQQPASQTRFNVQRCTGVAGTGNCGFSDGAAGWANIATGGCSGDLGVGVTSCTDSETLTAGNTYVYRIRALYGSLVTKNNNSQTNSILGRTTYGGNNSASQITVTNTSFAGLPSGLGWFSLGNAGYAGGAYMDTALTTSPSDNTSPVYATTTGSATQCVLDNYDGTSYIFSGLSGSCGRAVRSQSSGVADTNRNFFYIWGGGHHDSADNSMWKVDLTTNPVILRRVKTVTTRDASNNLVFNGNAPQFNDGSACVNAVPMNNTSTSYTISSIVGAAGTCTVTTSTAHAFVTSTGNNLLWRANKSYVKITGTTNFNNSGNAYRVLTVPDNTHFTISCGATATESAGTASMVWSSCVADATTGLGCSPNAIHSTQSPVYWQDPSNHANDQFFKYGGSASCGPGDSTQNDAWTMPLNGGVTESNAWVANHMKTGYVGYTSTGAGFPIECEQDTTTKLVWCADHSGSSLLAYDYTGSALGTANKWYTAGSSWANGSQQSSIIWHNAADTQRFFFAFPGCMQSQIVSASGNGTTVTYTLNGAPDNVGLLYATNTGKWFFYNTGGYDGGPITTFTAATGTNPTVAVTDSRNVGTMTTGFGTWCPASSLSTAIYASDITSYAGSGSLARADWTDDTLNPTNIDQGSVGYNTCAEAFSGGQYISASQAPLQGTKSGTGYFPYSGGISPGVTLYTGSNITNSFQNGDIAIWPNQGNNVYDVTVDQSVAGHPKLVCRRLAFSGNGHGACTSPLNSDAPCNTNHRYDISSTMTTWGTWHRFSYYPQPDVFFLINDANQPARILRIH
jgi:Ni,Fe-hydrogenase III small subunit